jgi:putative Mn2+ efflux pump MntP
MNNNNDIFKQWYQERARESKASFKLALGLATTTGIFGLVAGVSLCIGNVSATAATTAAGLVSGVASHRAFKLYEQVSQSLDDAAKTLLDNEGV